MGVTGHPRTRVHETPRVAFPAYTPIINPHHHPHANQTDPQFGRDNIGQDSHKVPELPLRSGPAGDGGGGSGGGGRPRPRGGRTYK